MGPLHGMNNYLIVGLGNIGQEYAHTRHNIGFDVADAFVSAYDSGWHTDRLADVAVVRLKGRSVTLIKPSTYMNLSGRAFRYWMDKEKVAPENTLTIVDDLAIPLERVRLRPRGSDAGHNGLRSIQEAIGTEAFPKLRFGIGQSFQKGGQVAYVLGRWSPGEVAIVSQKTKACVSIIHDFVLEGINSAMNRYNNMVFNGL
jgi:PTH1 family peptidyl-tRNA hydrolase